MSVGPKGNIFLLGEGEGEVRPCRANHHPSKILWDGGMAESPSAEGVRIAQRPLGGMLTATGRCVPCCKDLSRVSQAGVRCEAIQAEMQPLLSWSYTLECW